MANIKITHLYIYAAYSSIITSVQRPLWLIWVGNMTGIWIFSWNLWSLHSILWGLFTLQGICVGHQQPDGPQLLLKVCWQKGLLKGPGQSRHQSVGQNGSCFPLCRVCRDHGGRTALAALVNTLSSLSYCVWET